MRSIPKPKSAVLNPHTASTAPIALTVAGFDPSSGAGITADLQVFAAHGLFGTSAITALTVQSTQGVESVRPTPPDLLLRTLQHVSADLPASGVKVGMLGSEANVVALAKFLSHAPAPIPVVLDPVLRSSSGHALLETAAVRRLHTDLLPLAGWITPNWTELGALTGLRIRTLEQAREAADALGKLHPSLTIVVTGGDSDKPVELLRIPGGAIQTFPGRHIETTSTHGTGCAFSAALLSRLILGDAPAQAVSRAKAYVAEALRTAPGLGHGHGPLNLLWPLKAGRSSNC
ncbi:MAG TPA: bifunctional hydroxymethylpyrimidine kinase/phosphomethylpyrimidine kinase [Candidatus Aquilonibacter sp.]|nr:bifunctional hydroxymethylpyrimidine kinase/phosphomethylpyrimidine kinase [Candidatus Aquilonibacter sp.]